MKEKDGGEDEKGKKKDMEKKDKKENKGTKEKITDSAKLKAKLEKIDVKLQDLQAKWEDIVRQLKELEEGGKGKANEEKPALAQEEKGKNTEGVTPHVLEQGVESKVEENLVASA